MTRIVQVAPSIEPGSGVAGVAYALEQEQEFGEAPPPLNSILAELTKS